MKIRFVFALAASVFALASTASAQVTITGVSPTPLFTEGMQALTITGTNFGAAGTVTIGASSCTTSSWTAAEIRCTSPVGMGRDIPVVVTTGGVSSPPFRVSYGPPMVTGIMPLNGPTAGGPLLTIDGNNFGTTGTLTISGNVCTPMSWSHRQIRCTLPPGHGRAAPLNLFVSGQTFDGTYQYAPPLINAVSALSGPAAGGNLLTIMGLNFGLSPVVTIGGSVCVNSSASHTAVTCRVPAGTGMQTITVTALDQSASVSSPYVYIGGDAGADAASDAAVDAASDAAQEASADAASDARADTGPDVIDSAADASNADSAATDASDAATVADVALMDSARDAEATDASASGDAATRADAAADSGADGGTGPMAMGGCGCAVPGSTHHNSSKLAFIALAAMGSVIARRSRRRS